jgi:hypothetical protein
MSNGRVQSTDTNFEQSGGAYFAGCLMIVAGLFHMITGLVAIFKPAVYLSTANNLILLDYTQWGWVHFIGGIVLVASAASLFAGRWWGRFVAISMATISAIINFGFIWAYPIWSIMIIVLDIIIIYSVAGNGGRQRE